MTLDEKLQHFYDHSMEDAREEGRQILADYQANLDKLFEDHCREKTKEAEIRVQTEQAALERDLNKELSARQLDIRHELSARQDKIKEEIFSLARTKLVAMKADPSYFHWICRKIMISKKVANGEPMTVYLDPSDQGLQQKIEETTETRILLSKESFGGGIRIVIRSRHILIDDSFDTLLQDASDHFSFEGGVQL